MGRCSSVPAHHFGPTSARREVRKAQPDQSVGGTSLVGVFHQGQSGVLNPRVYFIHSLDVTSLDIPREIDIPLLGSVAGREWIKRTHNESCYGPQNTRTHKPKQTKRNKRTNKTKIKANKQKHRRADLDSDSDNETRTRTLNWPRYLLVESGDGALSVSKLSPFTIDKRKGKCPILMRANMYGRPALGLTRL